MGTGIYSYFILFTVVALMFNLLYRLIGRKRGNAFSLLVVLGFILVLISTGASAYIYFSGKQAVALDVLYHVMGGVGGYIFFIANTLIEQIFSKK